MSTQISSTSLTGIESSGRTIPISSCQSRFAKVKMLGREMWYDIQNHRVVKWQEGDTVVELADDLNQEQSTSTCTDCSSETQGTDLGKKLYQISYAQKINCIELHVNDKCNFRCNYCYLKNAGIEYLDNEMSREVATKAIDFLISQLDPGEGGVIKFYGGEPLLSYRLMKFVVEYSQEQAAAQGKKIFYTVNTNGTLLNDERIQWLLDNKIRVTISIDGNKESNDKFRVLINGGGTFDIVVKKAKQFLAKASYLNVRSTISDGTFQLKDSVLELAQIGDSKRVKLQTECNYVGDVKVEHADVVKLEKDHEELAQIYVDKLKKGEKISYANFQEPMFKSYYSIKTPYKCGAAMSLVGISPKGKMFPCHRFIDVHETEMGDVDNGLNGKMIGEFVHNRTENKFPCKVCWARHFCGGGCAFNNFFTHANIEDPNNVYCRLFRHQTALGLYIFTEVQRLKAEEAKAPPSQQPVQLTRSTGAPGV